MAELNIGEDMACVQGAFENANFYRFGVAEIDRLVSTLGIFAREFFGFQCRIARTFPPGKFHDIRASFWGIDKDGELANREGGKPITG